MPGRGVLLGRRGVIGAGGGGGETPAEPGTFDALYDAILSRDPHAYWPLNEASGTTGLDHTGNGRSTTHNNGLVGGGGQTFLGQPTPAFDGVNDYSSPSDHAAFSGAGASGKLSVLAFMRWTGGTGGVDRGIVTKAAVGQFEWLLSYTGGAAGGGNAQALTPTPVGITGVALPAPSGGLYPGWHMVGFSYNRATPLMRGVADDATAINSSASGTMTDTTSPLLIGGRGDNYSTYAFQGNIAHVAIWQGELTVEDFAAIFAASGL